MTVNRALISVSDKSGIDELARALHDIGATIVSSGGTAKAISDAGVPVVGVSEVTGFPEMLDGRVKTLHPMIHGGILARRTDDHLAQLEKQGIAPIDLVVVNLYPFRETIDKGAMLDDAIENIDIGGPTLIRSAAKNYESVAVVTNPKRYPKIIQMLKEKGEIDIETRKMLALEAFRHTAIYDACIQNYLSSAFNENAGKEGADKFPSDVVLHYEKIQGMRYGENPHQDASFYRDANSSEISIANAVQHSGKEISFNNVLDLSEALEFIKDFTEPAVVIMKHTNPCGSATNNELADAYKHALECDPMSAYGCVIGANRTVDMETAKLIHETHFVEACIAPGYEPGIIDLLSKKKNRRFMELPGLKTYKPDSSAIDVRPIPGGTLLQSRDIVDIDTAKFVVVTNKAPTDEQMPAMLFAQKVSRHVKSNSIILVQPVPGGCATVGIGAGQMSRVDSSIIAARKAGEKAKGSILASDAYFPFRDGIDAAAEAGIAAIVQPGGSKRDQEVIDACNEQDIAMIFTGRRTFRH